MRYEFMLPQQLEVAYHNRLPFLLPIGTIEFHGPHCAFGCDGLIAQGLAYRLESITPMVILPTFWYGASSYAAGGPEQGTIHVDADRLYGTLREIFSSLLEGGARRIITLIHHQFEQENYMPTTLAAASAAKAVTMSFLEKTRGCGWWGRNETADYYNNLDGDDNPFNWIRVLPCMSKAVQDATGYDHAGKYESSLLASLYPKAVKLENLSLSNAWFIQSAKEATPEIGEEMALKSVQDLLGKL
ncbi:MAG: creatininase family protein [Clostridia bacterium]|nr:creatininase family protein [Clostridia bacterium]